MPRMIAQLLVASLLVVAPSAANAQDIYSKPIALDALHSQGMERAWQTWAQVDPASGRLVAAKLHIHSTKSRTQYVVVYQGQREVFSETDIGPDGQPYGVTGAEEFAQLRGEVLTAEGIEYEIKQEILPHITLYLLSDKFVVHAIDGETGKTRWAAQVGRRDFPTSGFDVSDDVVVLANGMTLHCLDAENGSDLWQAKMAHTNGGAPKLTSNYAYVPKINGSMEVFDLTDPKRIRKNILFFGRGMMDPVANDKFIAWVSDAQALYVASVSQIVNPVQYRLQFERPISHNVVIAGEYFLITTDDGAVHCVRQRGGDLIWKQASNQTPRSTPLAFGQDIFIIGLERNLNCLDLETGITKWSVPNLEQVLSVTDNRVYARNRVGRITILDRNSGQSVGMVDSIGLDFCLSNTQTDRLYVGTKSGLIQCLHQIGSDMPKLHANLELQPNVETEVDPTPVTPAVVPKPQPMPTVEPEDDDDPFGIN